MTRRDIASYIFLSLAWGLSFLVLLKVVHAFGWVGAVTLRSLVAGATLLLIAGVMRRRLDFSPGLGRFAMVGATTVAGQLIGLSYGAPIIGTATAAILVAAIPLFSMLIGHTWGLERITPQGLAGLGVGVVGIVLLVGFPAVPVTPIFMLGSAATLSACFFAALGSNYVARHLSRSGAMEVTTGAFLTGGVMTLPLLFLVPVPGMPQPIDFLYLAILGGVMSATTYVVYFKLVTSIGATRTISVEFVVTIVAVLVGALVLGESLSVTQVIGAAVIVLGCTLVLGFWSPKPSAAVGNLPPVQP